MKENKSYFQRYAASPYTVWAVLFVVVPLVFILYYAFTNGKGDFTFENFTQMFDGDTASVFLNSVCFAFISTVICLLVAYPLAYFITKAEKRHQTILLLLFLLPMWLNFVLRTYALSVILEDEGIINSFLSLLGIGNVKLIYTPGAIILGMVYNFLPYMLLPIYTVMSKMDKRLVEASEDLGCNRLRTLFKVIIPLSIPGIVSGITMVFVPSVSTFYISQQLGPSNVTFIGDVIESEIKTTGIYNYASALSCVLMILILLCIAVMNKFSDDDAEGGMLP